MKKKILLAIETICVMASMLCFGYVFVNLGMFFLFPDYMLANKAVLEIPPSIFLFIAGCVVAGIGYLFSFFKYRQIYIVWPIKKDIAETLGYVITAYFFSAFLGTNYPLLIALFFFFFLPQIVTFYVNSFSFKTLAMVIQNIYHAFQDPVLLRSRFIFTETSQEISRQYQRFGETTAVTHEPSPIIKLFLRYWYMVSTFTARHSIRINFRSQKVQRTLLILFFILLIPALMAAKQGWEYLVNHVFITQRMHESFLIVSVKPGWTTPLYQNEISGFNFDGKSNDNYRLMSDQGEISVFEWTNEKVIFVFPGSFKTGKVTLWLQKPINEKQDIVLSNKVEVTLLPRSFYFPVEGESIFGKIFKRVKRILFLNTQAELGIFHDKTNENE